jgi:hypothetical protein
MTYAKAIDVESMPPSMTKLPIDERGFPVPWFVGWIDGKPDFRCIGPGKIQQAIYRGRCWVCGGLLGRMRAFVIGPMCAINRVSSEPPSHPACAKWSAKNCPFLTRPAMRRNEKNLPEHNEPPGIMLTRNPGVALVWWTLRYEVERHEAGVLCRIGKPERVEWYAQGREATRLEVLRSIESGLPLLREAATKDGPEAVRQLALQTLEAMKLIPKEARHGRSEGQGRGAGAPA